MAKKKRAKVNKVNELDYLLELSLDEAPIPNSQEAEAMKRLLSEPEFQLYSQLNSDIKVESESDLDTLIGKLQDFQINEPEIQVHSEAAVDHSSMLENELMYLCTILSPEERRALCAEVYYSILNEEPTSHLDLSDMITDCLEPTLARTALVKADADHKYSTAQYMQVYHCLKTVQIQYSLIFGGAMLDGLKAGADSIYWSGTRFK